MSTGPGWRRAIPARPAYFDFFADFPLDFRRKGLCRPRRARGGDHGEDGAQDRREAGKGAQGSASGGLSCPEQAVPQGLVSGVVGSCVSGLKKV